VKGNKMDTGTGNFSEISPKLADLLKKKTLKDSVFEVGEIVQLKKSQFKINNIGRHTLSLRLIPDDSYQQQKVKGE